MRIPKQMRTSLLALTAVFLFCIIIVCMGKKFWMEICEQCYKAGMENYLIYDILREQSETADELMERFRNKDKLDGLYKNCYKYLLDRTQ